MNEESNQTTNGSENRPTNVLFIYIRGIIGMIIGSVLGVYAFFWIVKQGLYAIVLPGVLAGLGCRFATPKSLLPLSIICAVFSLGVGFYTEWMGFPFVKDKSLLYFITNIHEVRPISLIMIALGGVFGFWFADRS